MKLQYHFHNSRRNPRGSALALVDVCALVIVSLVLGVVKIYSYLGGSQELKNSADAATLSVAQHAPEVKLKIAEFPFYSDVVDSTNQIGLMNINRVYGKAFLTEANAQQMIAEAYELSDRSTRTHAEEAFSQAKDHGSCIEG